MDYTQAISIPVIVAVVYAMIEMLKRMTNYNTVVVKLLPLIALILGVVCGIISYYAVSLYRETSNIVLAIVIGAVSGLSATGTNQIIQKLATKSVEAAKSIIEEDSTTVEKAAGIVEVAKEAIDTITDEESGISDVVTEIIDTAKEVVEAITDKETSIVEKITEVVEAISGDDDGIVSTIGEVISAIVPQEDNDETEYTETLLDIVEEKE